MIPQSVMPLMRNPMTVGQPPPFRPKPEWGPDVIGPELDWENIQGIDPGRPIAEPPQGDVVLGQPDEVLVHDPDRGGFILVPNMLKFGRRDFGPKFGDDSRGPRFPTPLEQEEKQRLQDERERQRAEEMEKGRYITTAVDILPEAEGTPADLGAGFGSTVVDELLKNPQGAYSEGQVASLLAKMSADERMMLGFPESLEGYQPQRFGHQELLDKIQRDKMMLGEVEKGDAQNLDDKNALAREMFNKYFWELNADELREFNTEWNIAGTQQEDDERSGTKFQQYQLPGGENYREVLLTLPERNVVLPPKPDLITKLPEEYHLIHNYGVSGRSPKSEYPWGEWGVIPRGQQHARGFTGRYYDTEEEAISEAIKKLNDEKTAKYDKAVAEAMKNASFTASHWEEPNVLAHYRMNERKIDDVPSNFLEEVQSDWHQKGRELGYMQSVTESEKNRWRELSTKGQLTDEEHKEFVELAKRQKLFNEGVPNAPFKKTWHELALKHALAKTAREGKSKLGWTTGEQQAERYDLSKQSAGIVYSEVLGTDDKIEGFDIKIMDKDGYVAIEKKDVTPNELSGLVGKEVAKKMMALEGENFKQNGVIVGKVLKDENLKVGGEGMKTFYDKMLPEAMNKIVKRHGGRVRVGDVHSLEIPESYKKIVAKKLIRPKGKGNV